MNSWNKSHPEELKRLEDVSAQPAREVIARRAYHIWESHGCPNGTASDDWQQAEAEIRRATFFRAGKYESSRNLRPEMWDSMIDEASEESFPASDPPATTCCTIA